MTEPTILEEHLRQSKERFDYLIIEDNKILKIIFPENKDLEFQVVLNDDYPETAPNVFCNGHKYEFSLTKYWKNTFNVCTVLQYLHLHANTTKGLLKKHMDVQYPNISKIKMESWNLLLHEKPENDESKRRNSSSSSSTSSHEDKIDERGLNSNEETIQHPQEFHEEHIDKHNMEEEEELKPVDDHNSEPENRSENTDEHHEQTEFNTPQEEIQERGLDQILEKDNNEENNFPEEIQQEEENIHENSENVENQQPEEENLNENEIDEENLNPDINIEEEDGVNEEKNDNEASENIDNNEQAEELPEDQDQPPKEDIDEIQQHAGNDLPGASNPNDAHFEEEDSLEKDLQEIIQSPDPMIISNPPEPIDSLNPEDNPISEVDPPEE